MSDSRRARRPAASLRNDLHLALALFVAATAGVYVAGAGMYMFSELGMVDFGKLHRSAKLFLEGRDMYAPDYLGQPAIEYLNLNPPHLHLVLLPLAPLAPARAIVAWMAMNGGALLVSLLLIRKELGIHLSLIQATWFAAALIGVSATTALVYTGHISMLLLVLMTCAWIAMRRGRSMAAGAWLGVLISIKPFAAIFLPWLGLRRDWPALGAALGCTAIAFVIGLLVFGIEAHQGWIASLAVVPWFWSDMNASVLGALTRWLSDNPKFSPLILAPEAVEPLWIISALAIGVATFVTLWTSRGVDRGFALLIVAALLISPLGWVYYWWLLPGPLAAMLWQRRPHRLFWAALPWMFVPLVLMSAGQPNAWLTLTLGSAYFWATALLWCWLVVDDPAAAGGSAAVRA
jgi:hypothetical protein